MDNTFIHSKYICAFQIDFYNHTQNCYIDEINMKMRKAQFDASIDWFLHVPCLVIVLTTLAYQHDVQTKGATRTGLRKAQFELNSIDFALIKKYSVFEFQSWY